MFKSKLRFLLILLIVPVLYLGWEQWLLRVPQPLPQRSAIATHSTLPIFPGDYAEVTIPPASGDQYKSAEYRLWVPAGVPILRGLLFKLHGCGDEAAEAGLNHANDLQWQALAVKHQLALMAAKFPTRDPVCDDWGYIDRGSGRAFLKALQSFAQKSGHPELDQVPWVLWGHSNGAEWVTQMVRKYPERTIAAVTVRCGGYTFPSGLDRQILGIPLLWTEGEKDPYNDFCLKPSQQVFGRYRQAGALWTYAVAANTAHEAGDTRFLAIPYLDAMLTARLAAPGTPLRPVEATQGWLGDPKNHAIAPIPQYQGNPLEAAWLPNQETARKWQQYVTKGKISPTQKPAAPTDVRVTRIGATEAVVTWHFMPDLENGLPSFRIYRNQALIQTLQGQGHNFGDAPKPPQVVLEYRDQQAPPNATYRVAAFNSVGESVFQ
ncbi:hypothetical protein BST81_00185 [Leptolyngbya sp. 'hensonii']|uniref:hypothetical protein n=1 Tax=Leptolyngbya sp. 'hensonii' TaxID=1922337 RepID=UPI00095033DA|nr:hypothetical protein [Leptolyngbya sp. 'hensonii']OLP20468.1 hypothetical protein BST81_00185 [Leptolyngbya sp. 'hensonii']